MLRSRSPLFWFFLAVFLVAVLTFLGPEEQSLGENVRIVYLHGAWVLAAEITLGAAGLTGALAILSRRETLQRWSAALGRTGIFFWVTYLPLSVWAMQANWNGLFTAEPRFRVAVIFAIAGLLLQFGLMLVARPALTSLANVLFVVILRFSLQGTDYVMHPPPSPIFNSGLLSIQLYFIGLVFLALAAAYFMTRWWLASQRP